MYYVIYNPATNQYAVEANGIGFNFGSQKNAIKFSFKFDAQYDLDGLEYEHDYIVVGQVN